MTTTLALLFTGYLERILQTWGVQTLVQQPWHWRDGCIWYFTPQIHFNNRQCFTGCSVRRLVRCELSGLNLQQLLKQVIGPLVGQTHSPHITYRMSLGARNEYFLVISLLNIKQMQRGDTELVSTYWQTHRTWHCIESSHTYVTIAIHSGPAVFTDGTGITQSHPDLTSLPLRCLIHRSLKPDRKIRVGVIRAPPERQRPKLTGIIIIFACAGK